MQEGKPILSSFLTLPFLERQTIEKDNFVFYMLCVRPEDYCKLVTDEDGQLRRCLFDSNGWDFLSANLVNEQISNALADPADLWTQNNGVTLIASNATAMGKSMQLQNVQIINGLQMSKIIYRHFKDGLATSEDEKLFVKIIVVPDAQTRAQIIEATSHQDQPVTIDDL